MNFLIVGYGAIGKERVKALLKLKKQGYQIDKIYIHDINLPEDLPEGVLEVKDITFKNSYPDWIFICTPHYMVVDWIQVFGKWDSKILIEKPMGRNFQEAEQIYSYIKNPEQLYVGFNYRFYGGISRLCSDLLNNRFGKLISIDMTLGHGGKPEDRSSWKLNPFEGSPDCLLDPGIHFLDILNHTFDEKVVPVYGREWKGFWNTGIQEEIHMIMTIGDTIVNFQSSLVRWRNTFRISVNGTSGYGIVNGRGKTYGSQTYWTGKRWGWLDGKKQSDSEKLEIVDTCEDSFLLETSSLVEMNENSTNCSALEALSAMKLYDECLRVIK